jgi:hypothetical protein
MVDLDVEDFIKGALQSVSEAQQQESTKLMEALGLTLAQELKARQLSRQSPRRSLSSSEHQGTLTTGTGGTPSQETSEVSN